MKHHLANARSKVGAVTTAQLVWILTARLPKSATVPEPEDITAEARGLGCLGVLEEVSSQAFAATGSAHRDRAKTKNSRQGISTTEKMTQLMVGHPRTTSCRLGRQDQGLP